MNKTPACRLPLRSFNTDELDLRRHSLGASDMPKLMKGEWAELWAEKTGRAKPKNLDFAFKPQLGLWTEPFNRAWYERETGWQVQTKAAVRHPVHAYVTWTPDGIVKPEGFSKWIPWEAKHCAAHDTCDASAEYYYAQLQVQAEIQGSEATELSCLFGNRGWDRLRVMYDADYVATMMLAAEEFWAHVTEDREPARDSPVAEPPVLDATKVVDFSTHNAFVDSAVDWLKHADGAVAYETATKTLKGLMPGDAGFLYAKVTVESRTEIVCIARDKAGKLALRLPNKKDKERIAKHAKEILL
jgi:YqaJ-like viral recombinase domain